MSLAIARHRCDNPIRIGASACLLGQRVRYDGAHRRDPWLVEALGPRVIWVAVCPEVELGLGVPRPRIRLVGAPPYRVTVEEPGARELTRAMEAWAGARADALADDPDAPLDGYVLKSRSPSCGLTDVAVYATPEAREPMSAGGPGLFARALTTRLPALPVVEETDLAAPAGREAFAARVLAHHARRCSRTG